MNRIVARQVASSLDRAILETLAYFDVFDFPVREQDLHRYLHGIRASAADLQDALHSLEVSGRIACRDGYYVLAGRQSIIHLYEAGARHNARRLHLALQYGRALARLPFVRMVAVTGSVAMQNGGPGADYDYLLVTQAGRLWLGRAFAILLGRWAGLHGHTLCPNILLSEESLLWPQRDLYAAHELTQMIPVSGPLVYRRLRALNRWTASYLPNADGSPSSDAYVQKPWAPWQVLVEPPLRTAIGAALERFEMRRKIARFRRQPGFGHETFFSADVCQGNFQQHGGHTRREFEHRLEGLDLEASGSAAFSDSQLRSAIRAPLGPGAASPATAVRPSSRLDENPAVAND